MSCDDAINTNRSTSFIKSDKHETKIKVRKLPVSFGNPALATYTGCVYMLPNEIGVENEFTNSIASANTKEPDEGSAIAFKNYQDDFFCDGEANIRVGEISKKERALCEKVVAIVGVPPEQIPEDLWNFVRAHVNRIRHVRILTSPHPTNRNFDNAGEEKKKLNMNKDNDENETDKDLSYYYEENFDKMNKASNDYDIDTQHESNQLCNDLRNEVQTKSVTEKSNNSEKNTRNNHVFNRKSATDSTQAVAMKAFPINITCAQTSSVNTSSENFAAKHHTYLPPLAEAKTHLQQNEKILTINQSQKNTQNEFKLNLQEENSCHSVTSYVVLFQLDSEDAVHKFISDLNGKPFTFLQDNVICNAYRVIPPLVGDTGLSLINPFFTSSQNVKTNTNSSDSTNSIQTPSSNTNDEQASAFSISSPMINNQESNKGNYEEANNTSKNSTLETKRNETHNCAVCLDLLHDPTTHPDESFYSLENMQMNLPQSSSSSSLSSKIKPLLTTVCNHTFHVECLLRWQDSPCPVCRYDHSGLNESLSQCHVCGTTENNYVCLICGVVSCGGSIMASENDSNAICRAATATATTTNAIISQPSTPYSHARDHYNETLHAYALTTQTQHVWDFAGDGYVHRLIHSSSNSDQHDSNEPTKIVEIHDPQNTTREDRPLNPELSDRQEGEVVHRKLEGYASEYHTLLKEQLDQQRIFYQEKLEEIRNEILKKKTGAVETPADLILALKQERNQLEQRFMTLKTKCQKVRKDVEFLSHMNEGLETNKPALERQIKIVKREKEDAKEMIMKYLPALEEKVKLLMLQLEMGTSTNNIVSKYDDRKPSAKK